jgi:hypothetical protein
MRIQSRNHVRSLIVRTITCLVLLTALLVASLPAHAAPPAPPAPDHPVLGTWKFTLPGGKCSETYTIRPDGTTLVTSGEEVAESNYEISAQPSAQGYYKWTDIITKDNGKKDCSGEVMTLGHEATNYIKLHPSGEAIIVCREESLKACFGPMVRMRGQKT